MNTWDELISAAEALRDLGDDWDGQGAKAPDGGAIGNAVASLRLLRSIGAPAPTWVIAGADGEVIAEWITGDGGGCAWFEFHGVDRIEAFTAGQAASVGDRPEGGAGR